MNFTDVTWKQDANWISSPTSSFYDLYEGVYRFRAVYVHHYHPRTGEYAFTLCMGDKNVPLDVNNLDDALALALVLYRLETANAP